MKIIKNLFLLAFLLTLCSCDAINQKEASNLKKDEGVVIEQEPSMEAENRQPIFVYNNQSQNRPKKMFLALNDKPQLLGDGYVRLLGVVMGDSFPVALVEISGKEKCLRRGEDCNGYRVSGITENGIQLMRKER